MINIFIQVTLERTICKSCQPLASLDGINRSEVCTSQVTSRPCAHGFHGKWTKKCQKSIHLVANNGPEHQQTREPRQHGTEEVVFFQNN